jgi:hypothetical protein
MKARRGAPWLRHPNSTVWRCKMDGLIMLIIATGTLGSFGYVMYLIHKESRESK